MIVDELRLILENEKFFNGSYSFFSDGLGNCLVLTKEGYTWIVYYAERGERTGVRLFDNEDEACQYFLKEMLSDPTARRKIFTPADFEQSPIWAGNDKKGYRPVLEKEPSPDDYEGNLFIKDCFTLNGLIFNGYLVGGYAFKSCGLFVKGHPFRIDVTQPTFTNDNILEIFQILDCKPFKFFPLHYESSVRLKGGQKLSGELNLKIGI